MEKVSDIHPFGVRMPKETREWLKARAKANRRTMNAELVFILENEKALDASTPKALDMNTQTQI